MATNTGAPSRYVMTLLLVCSYSFDYIEEALRLARERGDMLESALAAARQDSIALEAERKRTEHLIHVISEKEGMLYTKQSFLRFIHTFLSQPRLCSFRKKNLVSWR